MTLAPYIPFISSQYTLGGVTSSHLANTLTTLPTAHCPFTVTNHRVKLSSGLVREVVVSPDSHWALSRPP